MKFLISLLIVLLIVLQYKLWVDKSGMPDLHGLEEKLQAQQTENERLEQRNRELQAEVEDLKRGLAVIEERAREELGMIKDGETFFQVIEKSTTSGQAAANDNKR